MLSSTLWLSRIPIGNRVWQNPRNLECPFNNMCNWNILKHTSCTRGWLPARTTWWKTVTQKNQSEHSEWRRDRVSLTRGFSICRVSMCGKGLRRKFEMRKSTAEYLTRSPLRSTMVRWIDAPPLCGRDNDDGACANSERGTSQREAQLGFLPPHMRPRSTLGSVKFPLSRSQQGYMLPIVCVCVWERARERERAPMLWAYYLMTSQRWPKLMYTTRGSYAPFPPDFTKWSKYFLNQVKLS